MFKKISEQLFKYLYIISICEHIPKHWFLIALQAKVQSYLSIFQNKHKWTSNLGGRHISECKI